MTELVILTGEMQEGLIGCSIKGANFFARPLFLTAFKSVPSSEWLAKYHKQYFGLVTFERERRDKTKSAILLGVIPVDYSLFKENGFENVHAIETEKYKVVISDKDDYLDIERIDGLKIRIDENHIQLSKDDCDQFALLGNKTKDVLVKLVNTLKAGKVMTQLGPQPFMPTTQTKLQEVLNDLETILSEKVKLD